MGVGYQFTRDALDGAPGALEVSIVGLSAHVLMEAGFSAALNYTVYDMNIPGVTLIDGTHMGIGASYTFDAVTLHANYGVLDWETNAAGFDTAGYGLSAAYDFGGGLSVHLGYGWSEVTAQNRPGYLGELAAPSVPLGTASTWSLGLNMAF